VFTEVAHDVHVVEHRLVEGKNAIVFGRRGALAIDACNYADEGEAMASFIRSRGCAADRLALTHGHGDHILGSGAFRGADIYAHAAAPRTIEKHLPMWAERYFGGSPAAAEAAIARPNVLFDGELRLDLHGKTVRLFGTPGHSPDSACAFLEEDLGLCGGDTVVTGIVPAIADGDSRQLEATLRQLVSLAAEVLIPGHGQVLRGRSVISEHLEWMAAYLGAVRDVVEQHFGEGLEAVLAAADYARFVGDRLPEEPHGMPRRHRMVVSKIFDEISTELRQREGQHLA
jgi:glyoxylase-like metal-dependent hydrolase (beta-lactamase superfamily II)